MKDFCVLFSTFIIFLTEEITAIGTGTFTGAGKYFREYARLPTLAQVLALVVVVVIIAVVAIVVRTRVISPMLVRRRVRVLVRVL